MIRARKGTESGLYRPTFELRCAQSVNDENISHWDLERGLLRHLFRNRLRYFVNRASRQG